MHSEGPCPLPDYAAPKLCSALSWPIIVRLPVQVMEFRQRLFHPHTTGYHGRVVTNESTIVWLLWQMVSLLITHVWHAGLSNASVGVIAHAQGFWNIPRQSFDLPQQFKRSDHTQRVFEKQWRPKLPRYTYIYIYIYFPLRHSLKAARVS